MLRVLKQFLIQILLLTAQRLGDTGYTVHCICQQTIQLLNTVRSTFRGLQRHSRSVYAEGVCREPFCAYPALQLYLSQLSAILFIHGARLSVHHL